MHVWLVDIYISYVRIEHYRSRYPFMDLILSVYVCFVRWFFSHYFLLFLHYFVVVIIAIIVKSAIMIALPLLPYYNFIFNSILYFYYIERIIIEPWNVFEGKRPPSKITTTKKVVDQCMRTISLNNKRLQLKIISTKCKWIEMLMRWWNEWWERAGESILLV